MTRASLRAAALPCSLTRVFVVVVVALAIAATEVQARALPPLDRRVVDEAGALAPAERVRLEEKLASYEQRTGHQFAVVILDSLQGDALEELSMRAAEQWRLGDARRDDGLLLILAMQERVARIEVGYGLEGVITDALASRVIRDVMAPRLARGDVAGGLEAGLDALMSAASGESVRQGVASTAQRPPSWAPLIGLVVVVMLVGIANRRRRRRRMGFGGARLGAPWLLMSALGGGSRGRGGGDRGGFGGGGFSGGGGGFGGGGASGRW